MAGTAGPSPIGTAVARRLLDDGFSVVVQSSEDDLPQPRGGDDSEVYLHLVADVALRSGAEAAVRTALDRFGGIDVLIVNHAHSLATQAPYRAEAGDLDRAWSANERTTRMIVRAFARLRDPHRPDGRVILFTEGQDLGPTSDELPYVVRRGAVHRSTRSLAASLADRRIKVNAVNTGPGEKRWPSRALRRRFGSRPSSESWTTPEDIASVIAWLASSESTANTGDVVDARAGFRDTLGHHPHAAQSD